MVLVLNNPCGILDLRDVAVDVVLVSVRGGRNKSPTRDKTYQTIRLIPLGTRSDKQSGRIVRHTEASLVLN